MSQVMMMLGSYPFMIDTAAYEQLSRESAWRWKTQARIGRKPASQYLGPEAHVIRMHGYILPEFAGGHRQMPQIRASGDQGQPLKLVDGRGYIWGDFVITNLTETQTHFTPRGLPKRIDFQITLQEYGDDLGFSFAQFGLAGLALQALLSRFA